MVVMISNRTIFAIAIRIEARGYQYRNGIHGNIDLSEFRLTYCVDTPTVLGESLRRPWNTRISLVTHRTGSPRLHIYASRALRTADILLIS